MLTYSTLCPFRLVTSGYPVDCLRETTRELIQWKIMNKIVSKLDRRCIGSTLRQHWMASMAASKVQQSTLPPEPVIAFKKPFKVELVAGKRYSWCTCGHSKKQPFCDGSHKTKAPGLFPLRFVPDKDATVWLCGCKYTNNPPYCDGTHNQEFVVSAPLYKPTDS